MDFLKQLLSYGLGRAQEASTYPGLWLLFNTDFHIAFNGDFKSAATQWLMAGAGLIAVLVKEGWRAPAAPK